MQDSGTLLLQVSERLRHGFSFLLAYNIRTETGHKKEKALNAHFCVAHPRACQRHTHTNSACYTRAHVLPAIHVGTVERSTRSDGGGRILAWDRRINGAPAGDPGASRDRRARPAAVGFYLPAAEVGRVQPRGDEKRDGPAAEFVAPDPARAQVGDADRDGAVLGCGG